MKKNVFKTLMKGVVSGKLKEARVPTNEVDFPRLTVKEVHEIMKEEFAKALDTCDVKAKKAKKGEDWYKIDAENQLDWTKALKLKEVFNKE